MFPVMCVETGEDGVTVWEGMRMIECKRRKVLRWML